MPAHPRPVVSLHHALWLPKVSPQAARGSAQLGVVLVAVIALISTALVVPQWLGAQASPGCDAPHLLARSDVRQGVDELYTQSQLDGGEHVMLVFPDSVDVHPSAIVARWSIHLGVPSETIAIVHIHPAGTIEYPSRNDVNALKQLQLVRPGVCSYVAGTNPGGQRPIYEIRTDGTTVLAELF
jgi:hypothetical protein